MRIATANKRRGKKTRGLSAYLVKRRELQDQLAGIKKVRAMLRSFWQDDSQTFDVEESNFTHYHGLHDDRCALRKGGECNCPSAAFNSKPKAA